MTLYQKFKKLKINHSAIELGIDGTEEKYFCTPKGARIIGSAGVDGIHYCFVRGQGEMVFAVSPMNTPGKNVFPIARTFEDLLRLLMACGSMAALEQVHQWDEEQFEEYITENRPNEQILDIFDVLKEKLGIIPMDEPFTYLRRLQDSYNYGELNFSKEYYEIFNAYPIDEIPSEWKVTLEGGFQPERGKHGEEISINKQFFWGDELWHVPAAYLFRDGIVVDFCIQLNEERLKAFFNNYRELEEQGIQLSEAEQFKINLENPTNIDFNPKIVMNGESLCRSYGCGQTWIPSSILGDDSWEDRYGGWVLEHYGLDCTKAWLINRFSFERSGRRKADIQSLELCLERDKVNIPGIIFETPAVGESINFVHPITGVEHLLTIQEFEMEKMAENRFHDDTLEFPRHLAAMTYTIYPDLANDTFVLKDCDNGDSPRSKNPNERGHYAMSVGAIAVIRSNNDPSQVYYVNGEEVKPHVICSSLHFEPIQNPVEWRLIFHEKLMEDIEVELV